jgi:hypothetical protein
MWHAWRRRENLTHFLVGKLKEIDHMEGTGVKWIHLAQDRDIYHALVQTVMKLHILLNGGNFLPSRETTSFSRIPVHGIG